MAIFDRRLSRRQSLGLLGAGALATLPLGGASAQQGSIRQGYQTNIWGMPTYYLLQSGALAKHGIKVEEFAVPSGNLTMQQMVARQVDLGTFAGQSFLLGADKGDLVAIAQIEEVGKTAGVVAHKDLGITKLEQLRGKRIASQVGSSTANIFSEIIAPKHGLKKGDYQEIRVNANDMVAALAAKTVDATVNVEPYNAISVAEGIGVQIADYSDVDRLPVLMAATPDFVEKNGDLIVGYLAAWLDVGRDFKERPDHVAEVIYSYYTSKGYSISKEVFRTALDKVEVDPGFPTDLQAYLAREAQSLIGVKRIKTAPDWSKVLRPEFMEKARKA